MELLSNSFLNSNEDFLNTILKEYSSLSDEKKVLISELNMKFKLLSFEEGSKGPFEDPSSKEEKNITEEDTSDENTFDKDILKYYTLGWYVYKHLLQG